MLPELFKSFFSQIPFYQRYAMGPSFLVLWFFFSHVYCDMVLLFGKQSLHHVHAVEIEKNSRARDLENSIYKQVTSQIYLAEIILLMLATVVIYKKKNATRSTALFTLPLFSKKTVIMSKYNCKLITKTAARRCSGKKCS